MVFAHFATQKDILVFPCLRGVGLCDFMTLNTNTGDVKKYDIKFGKPGEFGRGGMETKLIAAKNFLKEGNQAWIANGKKEDIVLNILEGKDEGTKISLVN